MPAFAPSFSGRHPSITTNQGVLIIYEAESVDDILAHLPDTLELVDNRVYFHIGALEGIGVGAYSRSQIQVQVRFKGGDKHYLYPLLCLADCSNLVTFGREKYGKPFKYGFPKIGVDKDTLTLAVNYGAQEVVRGSMLYKHHESSSTELYRILSTPEIFLKFIPSPDGHHHQVCELVSSNNLEVRLEDVFEGQAALTFFPHVHAPFADLPIKRIVNAFHYTGEHQQVPDSVLLNYLQE